MPPRDTLSLAQARRVALAAQGFADPRPAGAPAGWAVRRLFDRVGLVQIDSVNVLSRAHYLPLFSRVGPYDRALMDRGAALRAAQALRVLGPRGVADPRRAAAATCAGGWSARTTTPGAGCAGSQQERPELVADVLDEVRERGPDRRERARGRGAPQAHRARGGTGPTSSARSSSCSGAGRSRRRAGAGFERLYDVPERVLPGGGARHADADGGGGAARSCCKVAARSMGVATRARPARLLPAARRPRRKARIAELVEEGALLPGDASRAGATTPTSTPPPASRARSTPARCSARSTR